MKCRREEDKGYRTCWSSVVVMVALILAGIISLLLVAFEWIAACTKT